MDWLYPFDSGSNEQVTLLFYLLAWLLGWLTIQVAIPLLWPRWTEDGGEFRIDPRHTPVQIVSGTFSQHRSEYRKAFVALILAALPWLIVALQTPAGFTFTGLLLFDTVHLHTIKQFTMYREAGQLGLEQWDRLPLYYAMWGIAAWMWMLALQRWLPTAQPLRLAAFGALAPVLPAVWLALLALISWVVLLAPWPRLVTLEAKRLPTAPVAFITLLVWGLLLLRGPAPYTYLDSGYWQASTWLRLETTSDIVVATSADMVELIGAMSGRETLSTPERASMALTAGMRCDRLQVRFRYQDACVMMLR